MFSAVRQPVKQKILHRIDISARILYIYDQTKWSVMEFFYLNSITGLFYFKYLSNIKVCLESFSLLS